MTEGGKYVYKTKKIHKRKSDFIYCALSDDTRPVCERVNEMQYGEFDSTLKHQYLQYIYTLFFPPNGKKWSFHAGARSHSLLHINKRTRPPVIRNRIEIETNEHTKPNSNGSSDSSTEKIQLENLYEANSVHVMLSKYIHRLKTRASHSYSIQRTHAHTHTRSLSIHPSIPFALVHACAVSISPCHAIRYDTMRCVCCAVERVCVCAM